MYITIGILFHNIPFSMGFDYIWKHYKIKLALMYNN